MKKIILFSIAFSFCFFVFSQSKTLSPVVYSEQTLKNEEKTSDEWTEVIHDEPPQDIVPLPKDENINNLSKNKDDKNKDVDSKDKVTTSDNDNSESSENKNVESNLKQEPELKENTEQKATNDAEKDLEHESDTEQLSEVMEQLSEDKEFLSEDAEQLSSSDDGSVDIEEPIKRIPLSIASEEILDRPDVEKFRQQYLSPKWSALLYSYLESAMEYRLYVRQQIQKRNLPEVLEYLPVVESNYKTNAKSYSGAVGMWQFMSNSVYPFLTLNDFVDQRLDPWYSTDAGLSKLEDNYKYFGDWLLAIAAYNCGGGAMSKAIRAAGVKDYWYLADNGYLPKQTASYIPKLLAIADLAINSEYYGIDLPNHNEEFELLENEKNGIFDYVTVHKAYSINELAKELRIEQSTMEKLNASYTMGITHPTKESKIRLPIGLASSAEAALEKMTPIEYPFKYKVVSGDSLWSISRKYNVTVSEICELNNIKENDILSIGKILYIPSK